MRMEELSMVYLILFLPLFAFLVPAAQPPERVVPVVNEVVPWEPLGQIPYELTWTNRTEDPRTLVDFEDLEGWTLELFYGADGEFRRSREQQIWGHYVVKIYYSGRESGSRIITRPPEPIPIPTPFDSVDLWGFGNRWRWARDETTPPAVIAVWVTDSKGKDYRIELTSIQWKQWWLIHRKVPSLILNDIRLPAFFSCTPHLKREGTRS